MNRPGTIKYLHSIGLPQKHIQIITHANQAYISKVINNRIRTSVEIDPILNTEEATRLLILQQLLQLKQLPNQKGLTDQDRCYIRLLRLLMVDKEDIEHLYDEVSKTTLSNIGRNDKIDVREFDSTLLNINPSDYFDFITTLIG